MYRQIDASRGQRLLDFFGEHSLGADFRQRNVDDLVASGVNDFNLDLVILPAQLSADMVRLPECELRTARSDPEAHQLRRPEPAPVLLELSAWSPAGAFGFCCRLN